MNETAKCRPYREQANHFKLYLKGKGIDIGCGPDVNIRDCLAEYRKEKDIRGANELIGDFSIWCASAILAKITGAE